MEIKDVKEFILSEMEKNIKDVLDGKVNSVKLYYVRPNDVIQYVVKLGGIDDDDRDTNGWQWDYWFTVKHNDKSYEVGGDGYYQNYCIFNLETD